MAPCDQRGSVTTRPKLFERQLRRAGLSSDVVPSLAQWQSYLATVERTYTEAEQDRYTLERSLAISSDELRALYDGLKQSSESLLAVERDKLKKSIALHEAIFESALDGVLVLDEHERVVAYSERFVELFQLDRAEVAALQHGRRRDSIATRVADPEGFVRRIDEICVQPLAPSHDELHLVDGRTIDRLSAPMRGGGGETYGRVWFFRDVTARKQQENSIRDVSRFLDSIVENLPHMVFVKDAATLRFVRINRAGEELHGRSRTELVGKSDHDLQHADLAENAVAADRKILAQRDVVTIEEPIETLEGRRWLSTKKIPILDDAGAPLYLLGISEDITEQLRERAELVCAKDTAEKASRAKSDFLLNMSHEMRTPLNAILGFARIVQREANATATGDHREFVSNIVQASEHMLALVNDLLDLRSLEQSKLEVAPLDLATVIHETIALVGSLIDDRELELDVEIPVDLPPVLADRRAVVQILLNLLSNAAKFTPAGGSVSLNVRAVASRVQVTVLDTGIGIAPEDQAKLFTYFEQVGGKHLHGMKGSGVGLALTRALVERQGGTIAVRSSLGAGSAFDFQLPVVS